jgi:hypothetical protein
MTYEPGRFVWAVMPMGADWTYAITYLLGGEFGARLFDLAMLLAIVALLYGVVRRWVAPASAWLLAALFAATPMVQLVTGELFVENLLAAMLLGMLAALWRFGETGERRLLYTAAALGGTALAVKFGALAFVACAAPIAIAEIRRRRLRWATVAAAALLFGMTAAPQYAIAWAKTGNPLFPFVNGVFHSKLLADDAGLHDARFSKPLAWRTLYDLTFRSQTLWEGQNGSVGFQYLLLIPMGLAAIVILRRRPAGGAAAVALASAAIVMATQPNARYIYAAFPLLTISFAAMLRWTAEQQRRLYGALLGFAVVCTAADIWFMPSSSFYHKDFYLQSPLSHPKRERYEGLASPIRKAVEYFSRTHPGAGVLLPGGESDIAGLNGDVYTNQWHQYTSQQRLRHTASLAEAVDLMRQWNVRYFIAREARTNHYIRPTALRELIEICTAREFQYGGFYESRLLAECEEADPAALEARAPEATPVAGAGAYDDFDVPVLLRGDWEQSTDFASPYRQTVSYSDIPGSEIVFMFQGTALTWMFTKAPNRGIAAVTIDGEDRGKVDLYSAAIEWQSRVRFCCFAAGKHTARIRVSGEKQDASSGLFVDVDGFVVE